MAARLLNWPIGLRANSREPLTGPRTIGAGGTQAVGGFVQTVASPFGLWRWRFSFPPIRGQMFRRYRGWATALHGGANATRVTWCEWDQMSFADRGIDTTSQEWHQGQLWSNGQPWSNGQTWQSANPVVPIAAAAAAGDTIIELTDVAWGHNLGIGDMLGFAPLHLGWYMVTEVIEAGRYRIWPSLAKALTYTGVADSDTKATLNPVMAARLEGEDAVNAPRNAAFADGLTITLVQVLDPDVRDWFTG